MKGLYFACVLALMGCPAGNKHDGGDDGGGGSDAAHPAWLVGGWDHDEGRSGFADYADYSIQFSDDGSYVWFYAVDELDGSWDVHGGTSLELDGKPQTDFRVGKSCRVMTLQGKTYVAGGTTAIGCPTTPVALTAVDKCVVGEFTSGTPNGGTFSLTFSADRLMVEFYDDPGYTSGGDSYTRYGEFAVQPNGDIAMVAPDGSSEVRASVQGLLSMSRQGTPAAGCDLAAFQRLGGGGGDPSCTLTCNSGDVCAAYGGSQTCCPSTSPFYCPDLDVCFGNQSDRDAACPSAFYGDPAFGCEAGQTAVTFTGLTGSYCAPSCNGNGSFCPTSYNGLAGFCGVHLNGNATANACVLECTDFGTTGGQCPIAMTCRQGSNGVGVCLF